MITLEIDDDKFEMTPNEYKALLEYENLRPDLFARIPYYYMVKMFLLNYRLKSHSPLAQVQME